MEGVVNYPFVVHFHQPVGQLERILERIYKHSYEMWLRTFTKHPQIKFSLHFSGCLLEWLAKTHPEFVDGLKILARKGQIEFIGGGYYEPILPLIPDNDKVAQIQLLTSYIEKTFNVQPTGFWLAERVWEPSLPKVLREANMQYVLIDDYHIRAAGYEEEQTFYTYFTEEQGNRIAIFPINERLRYLMLWEPQEKSIDYLKRARTPNGDRVVVYITDSEKYGEWSEPTMAEEWLNKYLSQVEQNPWIVPIHLSEYLKKHPPKGLVYIPCAAYDKMMEWSGGNFRGFLTKYREANNMHKKMLYVREKIENAEAQGCSKELLNQARTEVYMAQCNDAYWHGLFGGVYLPNLRQAVFNHLIRAEMLTEKAEEEKTGPQQSVKVSERDLDHDGQLELLFEGKQLNVYVKPDEGGNIFELDYKGNAVAHNFAGTLTRRTEAYHSKWEQKPTIDWYRRKLLRDHLLPPRLGIADFLNITPSFDLGDFTLEKFDYKIVRSRNEAEIQLYRLGHDWSRSGGNPLIVTKTIKVPLNSAILNVNYEVKNVGKEAVSLRFAPESVLIPPVAFEYSPAQEELSDFPCVIMGRKLVETDLMSETVVEDARSCRIANKRENVFVQASWSPAAELWLAPLKAVVQTEKAPAVVYEGSIVMPIFSLELLPDAAKGFEMEFQIVEEKAAKNT
jgi:predicted glycosyl hydrolase (DUF1957 family)